MRSWLLVRADDPGAMATAFDAGADALVLDFAAADTTDALRAQATEALRAWRARRTADQQHPFLAVRLRGLTSAGIDADLDALLLAQPDAVLLCATLKGADVQHLGAKLAVREAENGLPDGVTRIIASAADSGASIFGLGTYGGASRRLMALTWSAKALAADLRVDLHGDVSAVPAIMARNLLIYGAAAAGVLALDTDDGATDLTEFESACQEARAQGFSSKLARTADQVAIINRVFAPAPAPHPRPPGG